MNMLLFEDVRGPRVVSGRVGVEGEGGCLASRDPNQQVLHVKLAPPGPPPLSQSAS